MKNPVNKSALVSYGVPVLLLLATASAFFPGLQNQFVDWDDYDNFVENPSYRGLAWSHLRWMFTTVHLGNYRPLTWVTFGIDSMLWGTNPVGYHLTSLLLHAVNVLLFYFLAVRLLSLTRSSSAVSAEIGLKLAAGLAALIFAVHPLQVEAVAWASARNHLLAALFFLSSVLCYLRAAVNATGRAQRWPELAAPVSLYGLSLLSQPSALTLPFVLVILDIWPLRRLGGGPGKWFGQGARPVWWEKLPFLLLAAAGGLLALAGKGGGDLLVSFEQHGIGPRAIQALFGLSFYLWKLVFPLRLAPIYEVPTHLQGWHWWLLPGAAVAVALALGLYVARRRWPAGLAAFGYYVAVLAPVLGIAQYGPQIVADRYSYTACLVWALFAGALLLRLWRLWEAGRVGDRTMAVAAGVVVLLFGGLSALTWKQTQVWRDSETLWNHTVAVTEDSLFRSSFAHYNLGRIHDERGEQELAIDRYRKALEIYPRYSKAHYNLANTLARQGQLEQALEHYRRTLESNPKHYKAHINLGNLLARQRNLAEAIDHYREALRIEPESANALFNLGLALLAQGELKEAIVYFRRALRIQPDFAEAHEHLGMALIQTGKKEEAVEHYEEAVRIIKSRRAAGAGG